MINIKCNFYNKDGKHKGFYSFDGNTSMKDVDIVNQCKTFDPNAGEYFIQVSSGTTYFIIIPYEIENKLQNLVDHEIYELETFKYFVSFFSNKGFNNGVFICKTKISTHEDIIELQDMINGIIGVDNCKVCNFQLLEA